MKKILSTVFVLTFSLAAAAGGGQPQQEEQGIFHAVLQECGKMADETQLTPHCRAAVAEYKARIPAETAKIRQMDLAQIDRALPVYCGGDPWGTSPLCRELIQRYQTLEEAEVGSLLKDKTRLRREYQACTDKILPLRVQAEAARKRYFEQGEKDADQQEWFARSDKARQIASTYPCREVKKARRRAGGSENAGGEW